MHGNSKNLLGQTFGDLTVIELSNLALPSKRSNVWKCRCSCGNICYKTSADLTDKRRKTCSCGCKTRSKRTFPNKFIVREQSPALKSNHKASLEELCDRMEATLREAVELVDELEGEGADGIDVLCDRNYQIGYQTAANELRELLGKKPLTIADSTGNGE